MVIITATSTPIHLIASARGSVSGYLTAKIVVFHVGVRMGIRRGLSESRAIASNNGGSGTIYATFAGIGVVAVLEILVAPPKEFVIAYDEAAPAFAPLKIRIYEISSGVTVVAKRRHGRRRRVAAAG